MSERQAPQVFFESEFNALGYDRFVPAEALLLDMARRIAELERTVESLRGVGRDAP